MMNDEALAQLIAEAEAAKLKAGDIVCPKWAKCHEVIQESRIRVMALGVKKYA